MAHFAFFPQREQLDKRSILKQYGELLSQEWMSDETMRPMHQKVQNILTDVESRLEEVMKQVCPYKTMPKQSVSILSRLKGSIAGYLPYRYVKKITENLNNSGEPYILK